VIVPHSSSNFIFLVDPHKESGQNLYRQYAGKKGKIVLHYRWVHECICSGALQTFHSNWAGCKVTGMEKFVCFSRSLSHLILNDLPRVTPPSQNDQTHPTASQPTTMQPVPSQPQAMPPMPPSEMVHPPQAPYGYPVYGHPMHVPPRSMQPPTAAPPQSWQAPNVIAPQQTHIASPQTAALLARQTHPYRDEPWVTPFSQPPPHMVAGPSASAYDYRYGEDRPEWAPPANDYSYDPASVSCHASIQGCRFYDQFVV